MVLLRLDIVLKNDNFQINVFICGLLRRDECISINFVYITETNKILKVKCSLNRFIFSEKDSCWSQPNGCLNSGMFYLDKKLLVEKGNLVSAKYISRPMEHFHKTITRDEFKTSYKLAIAFQLNNVDFPALSSKYACNTVSDSTKVPQSKVISNLTSKFVRKVISVCKFVSVTVFAQSVCSPSYHVVKSCDFDLVN